MIDSPVTMYRICSVRGFFSLLAALSALAGANPGYAEEAWEYSTYRVDVVVVAAPGSGLSDVTEAELRRVIRWNSGISDLAVWDVQPRSVPRTLRYELANSFHSPDVSLITELDLVVITKKDKHPELKLKKLDYLFTVAEEAKDSEKPLRVGICDPRRTIVGHRARQLLYRHWLASGKSSTSELLDSLSAKARTPSELIDQVLSDELDLALIRKTDVPSPDEEPSDKEPAEEPAPEEAPSDDSSSSAEDESNDESSEDALDVVPVDEVFRKDKLFLVVADIHDGQYRVRAREFDCRGHLWGPIKENRTSQIEALPQLTYEAVEFSFAPVVRIEEVSLDGKQATTRLRAGGLIDPELSPDSPARLDVGAIMRPVIRRNDRLGNVLEVGGIEALEWTYLQAISQDGVRFECDVYSAFRNPVGGRSSPRVERTALLVRPTGDATQLRMVTRDDPPQPLPNYEIYEKGEDDKSVLLGRTDWRGSIKIAKGENPIRVVYVKNGRRVLARLPIVPGLYPVETAETRDDSHRLWAEGRIRALKSSFMDLVVRRRVLADRIRKKLEEGEVKTAKKLSDELSAIPTRDDFRLTLQELAHDIESDDPREQARIEILLDDVRRILPDYLDPQLAPSLERAVDNALKAQGLQ